MIGFEVARPLSGCVLCGLRVPRLSDPAVSWPTGIARAYADFPPGPGVPFASGSSIVKAVPLSTSLCTEIVPS